MTKKVFAAFFCFIFVFVTLVEIDSADARRRRRRPRRAPTLSPEVDLVVTFGDRVSVFQLVKDKREFYFHFFNSAGQRKDLLLSKTNYEHLVSQSKAAGSGLNYTEDCPRNQIQLEVRGSKTRACLNMDQPAGKKLIELANSFSVPL